MLNQIRVVTWLWVAGILALVLGIFSSRASADVALARQGKPLAKIVLGNKATGVEKHAARELQKYIKQISGAELGIISEKDAASGEKGTFVLLGTPGSSELVAQWSKQLDIPTIKHDGFVIRKVVRNGASYLVLASPEARGCLYAAYDLLENALDVGFFWAGDHVPQAADVSITPVAEKVSSPYFKHREYLQGCAIQYSWMKYWNIEQWKKEIDWAAKHKFNMFWYPRVGATIYKRAYKRVGLDLGAPTAAETKESAIAHQIIDYARSLGMKVVGTAFSGKVEFALKKSHPDAKYLEIQREGIPFRLYLYPSDPLFVKLGQYLLEEYIKEYGTDHIYDTAPWPECRPGESKKEQQDIKVYFAKSVCEYIRKADPKGIFHMSGWAFQDKRYWTVEDAKCFLAAIPDDMYLVNDIYADMRPDYKRLDYFYGKNWGFGVLHCLGGENHMHGRLQDLINRVMTITQEEKAQNCINFYLNPEINHYNPLFYELAADLSWNPRQITLNSFLEKYARLRYGADAAGKMKDALQLLADSVYGDKGFDNDKRGYPRYWKRLGGIFPKWLDKRYSYISPLRQAMEIMLTHYPEQKDNPFFLRDFVDVTKQYIGDLFNHHIVELYNNFMWELPKNFEKEAKTLDKLLQLQERLLACWKPYQIRNVIDSSCAYSPHLDKQKIIHDVKETYTILRGMETYPANMDYLCADMYELLRDFYRPRVDIYVDELRMSMNAGKSMIPSEKLEARYKALTEKWLEKPLNRTGYKDPSQIVSVVRDILNKTAVPAKNELQESLKNGDFEAGKKGWKINATKQMETNIADRPGEDKKCLHFKSLSGDGAKDFSYSQEEKWKGENTVALQYYLVKYSRLANVSLSIEAFDKQGQKKAQVLYFAGGQSWAHGNVGPDRTGGFYNIRKKVASDLNKWHLLVVDPQKDLDAIHGNGLWGKLSIDRVRISIKGWCFYRRNKKEQTLEGFVDGVKIVTSTQSKVTK